MARRKNTKRIDPRYFLHETVNRGEEIEEGLIDNIKSFLAPNTPGKALAARIKSNGGGAEGAIVAAADLEELAKGAYENAKSPLLKNLHRAYNDDPELYRATIVQVAFDEIGEKLTQPPSHRGGEAADQLASSLYASLDKPGKQLMLRMWDASPASRDYENRKGLQQRVKASDARAKYDKATDAARNRQDRRQADATRSASRPSDSGRWSNQELGEID